TENLAELFSQNDEDGSHPNFSLNLFVARKIKNEAIPKSITVSCQIYRKSAPFSITSLIIRRNHFAGTIFESHCSGQGILETGKINPERIIVGSINPIND